MVLCVPTPIVVAHDTLLEGGVEKSQGIQPFSYIAHTCHVALSHFAFAPCMFGSSAVKRSLRRAVVAYWFSTIEAVWYYN